MMSASSSGSFHSSLYLLAVSMTLAAVYLWGAKGSSGQGREVGPREGKLLPTSRAEPFQSCPSHSQAHGAAPQGTRLPLQGGADDEVREQEERPVLFTANCLL